MCICLPTAHNSCVSKIAAISREISIYDTHYIFSVPGTSPQWVTATSDVEVEAAQRPAVWNVVPTLCDSGGEAVHRRRIHTQ